MSTSIKHANTIRLPDTADQYSRRVHINVRGEKVTMVYRWKDQKSSKAHTQRMTLDDEQVGRLLGALMMATDKAIGDEAHDRLESFGYGMSEIMDK